jgi:hypothetical protein
LSGANNNAGFVIIIIEVVTKWKTNRTTIRPIGQVFIQSNQPYIQSTITHSNLTGPTIFSIKLQTGGLRVCSVANTRGTETTPCNGETFEANGIHTERSMIHSWIGKKSMTGAITEGEDLILAWQCYLMHAGYNPRAL